MVQIGNIHTLTVQVSLAPLLCVPERLGLSALHAGGQRFESSIAHHF